MKLGISYGMPTLNNIIVSKLLLFLVLFFSSCVGTDIESKNICNEAYGGKWYSEDGRNTFQISLNTKGDSIFGYYCAIYNGGERIDCGTDKTDLNINGVIQDSTAKVYFNSFFNATNGEGKLRIHIHDSILIWSIDKYPEDGDCFAPKNAVLHRKRPK